jgi:hypothetical protein
MCHEMCVLVTSTYSTSNLIVTHPRHHDAAPRNGTSPSGRRFLPADGRSSLVSHGCQTVPLARPKQAAPSSPPDAKPTYGTFLFLDPHVGWTRGTTPRPAASGSISRKERGHAARARGPRASIPLPASALPQWAVVPLASGATTETTMVPPVKRVFYIAVSVGLRGFPHHDHSGPATTRCVRGGAPRFLRSSLSLRRRGSRRRSSDPAEQTGDSPISSVRR